MNIGAFLWVFLNWEKSDVAVLGIWNWWEVTPEELSWDVNFSDVLVLIWKSKLFLLVSVGNWSGFVIPGIGAELAGLEISVISVGDVLSLVSVLLFLDLK